MSSHFDCFPSLHASFSMVARNGHVGEVGSSSTYKDLEARLRSGKVGGIDSQDESTGTTGTGREWSISSQSFGTFGAIIPHHFFFFSLPGGLALFSLIWIFKSHHHRHRHRHRHHASYYQESETTVGGQPCHHPSARTAFKCTVSALLVVPFGYWPWARGVLSAPPLGITVTDPQSAIIGISLSRITTASQVTRQPALFGQRRPAQSISGLIHSHLIVTLVLVRKVV